MDKKQVIKARLLGQCIFPVGSNQKRFARNMSSLAEGSPETEITEKQAAYLDLLFHQYRRQMKAAHTLYCDCHEVKKAREQQVLPV